MIIFLYLKKSLQIGYMGSGELLHVVAEYIRLIKSKSPHVKYGKYGMINENK
jgi:pyridoxal/pyridoxine/pyridoxamine kinase